MWGTLKTASSRFALMTFTGAAMATAFAATAHAQDQAPAGAAQSEDEVIVVTGSRIPRPGFTSNSPVATVGAAELDLQQPSDIEQVLRGLPQFVAGNSGQINNGSSGTSTLDLRGLTTPRTLPLINGRRMVGFDPNGLFDVTAVPLALLERVDVVTGGASAVYGSDAVAGVVNFILVDDFQGVQLDADYGITDHGDGERDSYQLTLGSNLADGRGNVALSLGYLNQESVFQTRPPGSSTPGASSTTIPTAIDSATGGRTQISPTGTLVPFYRGFDFNPQNLYQSPQERWTATALGSYEINDNIKAYSRLIFSSSTTAPQLASSGTFGFTFAVPLSNPFLSAQARSLLAANNPVGSCASLNPYAVSAPAGDCVAVGLRRRTVEVGAREYSYEYDTFQSLVGLRGTIAGWDWDIAAAHGETSLKRQQRNDLNADRIQQALFATSRTACFDTSNFCSPLNLFDPNTPLSAAAADFIRFNLQVQSLTTQDYFTSNLTGDLGAVKSPFAESPIGVSFGLDYREEEANYEPDAASQSGASPGFGQTLPTRGKFDVLELYVESLVPLIENAPFAKSINAELGFRTSDYSTSGKVESYKYGLEWAPIESLRFRGMFQRAVRAANISELFTPFTPSTGDLLRDPCAAGTAAAPIPRGSALYNLCLATGVPAARLNAGTLAQPTSGQVNNFLGGNPDLTPEEADTKTFGFVFQPDFLPGFSATIDYYDIEVNNAISVRPAFDIMDGCYNLNRNTTASASNADCQLIRRNVVVGNIEGDLIYGVEQVNQNIGSVHVEGIDYSLQYVWDFDRYGQVTIGLDGTHGLDTSYRPSPGAGEVQCLGFYGKTCGLPSTVTGSTGGPESEDRWVQRTTWSIGNFDLSYRWRHLSETALDALTSRDAGNAISAKSKSIPAFDYIDLSGAWQVSEFLRLNANVTNVTGEEAPFVQTETGSTTFNSGNTYPATYDVLGRVITLGVSARF
jgi:outer membrane receptor protein involved in Fe transport